MALTIDALKEQEQLKELTEDQLQVMIKMAANDAQKDIDAALKKAHDLYDLDFGAAVPDLPKQTGEKTYEYGRRVLTVLKEKTAAATTLEERILGMEAENKGLQEKIKAGTTDTVLVEKAAKLERDLGAAQAQLVSLKTAAATAAEDKEKAVQAERQKIELLTMNTAFALARTGLTYKPEYAKEVVDVMISNAEETIAKQYRIETRDINGKPVSVLVDRVTGLVVQNEKNAYEPMTPAEMLIQKISPVIEPPKTTTGGGTASGGGGGNKSGSVEIGAAKTKSEAVKAINSILTNTEGLKEGTPDFAKRQAELYIEHKVSALPAQ